MSDHDSDITMAGIIAGLLLWGALCVSCLCHLPRGPQTPCTVEDR